MTHYYKLRVILLYLKNKSLIRLSMRKNAFTVTSDLSQPLYSVTKLETEASEKSGNKPSLPAISQNLHKPISQHMQPIVTEQKKKRKKKRRNEAPIKHFERCYLFHSVVARARRVSLGKSCRTDRGEKAAGCSLAGRSSLFPFLFFRGV